METAVAAEPDTMIAHGEGSGRGVPQVPKIWALDEPWPLTKLSVVVLVLPRSTSQKAVTLLGSDSMLLPKCAPRMVRPDSVIPKFIVAEPLRLVRAASTVLSGMLYGGV